MSNMSYCRFENTLQDLLDCFDALEEETPRELMEDASEYERNSILRLLEVCKDISERYDVYFYERTKEQLEKEENQDE